MKLSIVQWSDSPWAAAQGAAGNCGYFCPLHLGLLSYAQGQIPATSDYRLPSDWMANRIKRDDYAERSAYSHSVLRVLTGLQPCWPWTSDMCRKFRAAVKMSIPCPSVNTQWVCLFHQLVPPIGSSQHSYLFPQDPCRREYTLQSMICGPWLRCSHQAWLDFMPCDM